MASFCVAVGANCDKETLMAMQSYVAVTSDGIEKKLNVPSKPSATVP